MADSGGQSLGQEARVLTVASQVVGLMVFVAGIIMIALVFSWTYQVFSSVDDQIARVRPVAPSSPPVAGSPKDAPRPPVVVASPRDTSILQTSAVLLLKFAGLFVLGWIASLVAARGAALAMGSRAT